MIYQFREGSRFPVKPQVAGDELERIAGFDPKLKPATVVDESRPDVAPLHRCFEWDDELAAERYRVEQARSLIRCVVRMEQVGNDPEPRPVQMYVHVTTNDEGPCYAPTSVVMADDDLREQAIGDALKLLQGVTRRYEHLNELQEVFAAIDLAAQRAEADARRRAGRTRKRAVVANANA